MTLRSATKTLVVLSLALPVVNIVLLWVRGLVMNMGDVKGAEMLGHLGTLCQVTWAAGLVGLVIVVALATLNNGPSEE
jgi:hypothetical protein